MKSKEDRYAKIFGAYDIRGIVGEELNSPIVEAIAGAPADYPCPGEAGQFIIGNDARWTSLTLAEAASVGFRASGHRVHHNSTTGRWCL